MVLLATLMSFLGDATRHCDEQGYWQEPNVLGCISKAYVSLEYLVSDSIILKEGMTGNVIDHKYYHFTP